MRHGASKERQFDIYIVLYYVLHNKSEVLMSQSLFELAAKSNDGKDAPMAAYEGKVVLVVNTASKCGFTPQYEGLEAIYRKYEDRGLVVLGFPCDQFAHQEPEGDEAIAQFCKLNFGVTFPLMAKIEVNGPGTHPIFAFLKQRAPGVIGKGIKWNFTKFLIGRDGATVKRFSPTTEPAKLEKYIEAAIAKAPSELLKA
jgi:glutathione peroxidase